MSDNGINHTKVSPSGVGDYAVCPLKLYLDSAYPDERVHDPYVPHKDFGTVCHFVTQYLLGCAPDEEPADETLTSARQCPGVPKTPAAFDARVQKCSQKAVQTLEAVSPLPPGTFWVSEHSTQDKTLLPWRKARRTGLVEGFGGSIDLLRNDRAILWDLKFTGRIPEEIKTTYLWQLGSYHICSDVPKTGILWVSRDGNHSAHLCIDWTDPKLALLKDRIRRFVEFTAHKNFPSLAWPVKGEACTFCQHKGSDRCPVWHVPPIENDSYRQLETSLRGSNDLDDLLRHAQPALDKLPDLL